VRFCFIYFLLQGSDDDVGRVERSSRSCKSLLGRSELRPPHTAAALNPARPTRVPRELAAGLLRLARAESLELVVADRHPSSKPNAVGHAVQDPRAARVTRTEDTLRARLGAREWDTALCTRSTLRAQMALAEVLDHRRLHRELDEVEGEEP